ncbi:MAG: O-antigen ligase family protein [candidate division Zixibacteria bacterium]
MLCLFPMVGYRSRYSGKRTIDFLIYGTAVSSALALFRYFSGAVDRAAPFSGGYTTLAIFIAAVIPLAIWKCSEIKSSRKWIYTGLTILMAFALVFTKTRAGWLAALVGLLIIGFTLNKKRTLVALSLGIVLIAIIPNTRNIILERFEANKKGGVTSGRVLLYKSVAEPLSALPIFGYGPGSFTKLVSPNVLEKTGDTRIKSWHSTPLEILLESGSITLLIFMILAFLPVKESLRKRKYFPSQKLLQTAVLGSLTALYLAGLTTNLARDFMLLSLLALLWSIPYSIPDSFIETGGDSETNKVLTDG